MSTKGIKNHAETYSSQITFFKCHDLQLKKRKQELKKVVVDCGQFTVNN